LIEKFKNLLEKYDKVSIITHKNPDADSFGSTSAMYTFLMRLHKKRNYD